MSKSLVIAATLFFIVGPAYAEYSTPVRVLNSADEAVPTQHPREPIIFANLLNLASDSYGGAIANYVVPNDRRLVIEFVSLHTNGPDSCSFVNNISVSIPDPTIPTGGASFNMNPIPPIVLSRDRYLTRGSQSVKLYASPGSEVDFYWSRTENGCKAQGVLAISGYLEEDLM